jgi:uncharacterized protein YqjF (DUF2071 family)
MPPIPTIEQRIAASQPPNDQAAIMYQQWRSLLFLHWPIAPSEIQKRLPAGLQVDCHQGAAYLGIVPFYMHGLRPRYCPPLPAISYFPELNLRTYVYDADGQPGVWFFSLDAQSHISVWCARNIFNLNYHYARMRYRLEEDGEVKFSSTRPGHATQSFCYQPTGSSYRAVPGSLDYFLLERYRLFTLSKAGRLMQGRVHHRPYQIQAATVIQYSDDLFKNNKLSPPAQAPAHICYSAAANVSIYPMH